MRLWFVLIVIVMAAPLRADPACEAVDALGRLVTKTAAGDLGGLERELRRTDTERVMWNLTGHPLTVHRRDIAASVTLAVEAVELARVRGHAAAAHLTTDTARATTGRLAALLSRHVCAPEDAAAARGAGAGEPTSTGAPPDGVLAGMRMARLASLGAGALALCALAALGAHVIALRRRKRKRQAQRHAVNLPARIRSGTAETGTRLIDISRLGAKLRLDPEFEPAGLKGVTILLGDRRIGATAKWRNRHYVGVQFLRPLPDDAVAPILTLPEPEGGVAPPG